MVGCTISTPAVKLSSLVGQWHPVPTELLQHAALRVL